jgi:hypothetical protein
MGESGWSLGGGVWDAGECLGPWGDGRESKYLFVGWSIMLGWGGGGAMIES